MRALQHIASLIEREDFNNTIDNLIQHVKDAKVSRERKRALEDFLESIRGKGKFYAAWAFRHIRQLVQKTSRAESNFSSMKAQDQVNVQKDVAQLQVAEFTRAQIQRLDNEAEAMAAVKRASLGKGSKADDLTKAIGTHVTDYAINHVREEFDASSSYVVAKLSDVSWRVSAKKLPQKAKLYGPYRTTYDVTLMGAQKQAYDESKPDDAYLVCSCDYQVSNLMPCRHIISCKKGKVTKKDFHPRWLIAFALIPLSKSYFLNVCALSVLCLCHVIY